MLFAVLAAILKKDYDISLLNYDISLLNYISLLNMVQCFATWMLFILLQEVENVCNSSWLILQSNKATNLTLKISVREEVSEKFSSCCMYTLILNFVKCSKAIYPFLNLLESSEFRVALIVSLGAVQIDLQRFPENF